MPPKPKKSTTEEDDPDSPVTYRGLESELNKHLDKTIEALQSSLEATTKIANKALTQVSKLEKEVAVLKEEIVKLKKNDAEQSGDSKRLEENVEDRQLRKTFVFHIFHIIPEIQSETLEQTE